MPTTLEYAIAAARWRISWLFMRYEAGYLPLGKLKAHVFNACRTPQLAANEQDFKEWHVRVVEYADELGSKTKRGKHDSH